MWSTGAVLVTLGDLVEDIVVWPVGPMRRGTDTESVVRRVQGGSAANVAVFASRAGTRARFVGCIGNDHLGDTLLGELVAAGVEPCVTRHGRTGSIVVIVGADGERSFLTDRGSAVDLGSLPPGALTEGRHLHVSAYCLEREPLASVTSDALQAARRSGLSTSVDAASVALLEHLGAHRTRAWLTAHRPDVLFVNEAEGNALESSSRPIDGVELTVVKRGARPVRLVAPDGSVVEIDVPPVDHVRDTTGAGDAFAAGFLCARLLGAGATDAARAAVALAAQVLAEPGAAMAR